MEITKRRERLCPPAPTRPAPWLVFPQGKGRRNQTFCSILDPNKNYHRRIPAEMRRKVCWVSCFGWLVMSDLDHYFMWNPVTMETIQLPPLPVKSNQRYMCTLSSPPSNPDSMVFFFGKPNPLVLFCRPGDKRWTEQKIEFRKDTIKDAVGCNGKLYALTFHGSLVVFNTVRPDRLSIRLLEAEKPEYPPNASSFRNYLVESCGELFFVRKLYLGMAFKEVSTIEVHRMDFSRMVWVKVEDLGDQVFFLGGYSSVSCSATESGLRGGCIYFTMAQDKSLFAFNLEDRNLSVSLPCPKLQTPWFSPIWVMPDLRLIGSGVENQPEIKEKENGKEDMVNMKVKEKESFVRDGVESIVVEERDWSDLPRDLLTLIGEGLLLVDYMHFRATSRACRLVAPLIQWRTASVGLEMESLFPWLMFFKKDNDICNFIDPKHNDTYFTKIPELLSGAQIRFSKDGWLLMSRGNHSIFFFNPFTRAEIQLPDIDCYHFTGISFSSSPTSSDCVVFGICDCCVDIIRKGEEDWSRYPIDYRPYDNNPVFYKGAFYCLGREGNIGVFDLKDDRFTWTVLAKPKRPCMLNYQNFLTECDGELISVFVGRMGKQVQVFRLNCSEMVWTEVESLGNHMLFVSHSSSLSAVAKTPQMENKIYFPRFRSNSIVYYSLETGMYHSFGSEHSAPDFYDTREQLHCGWIEPRWFRTTEDEIHWHGDTHCL